MDAVDALKARAVEGLRDLGELANELDSLGKRREALRALEKELEKMMEDGSLTPEEKARLRSSLAELGLDAQVLSGDASGSVAGELRDVIEDAIADAESSSSRTALRAQFALNRYSTSVKAASEVSRSRHKAYMTVIDNLRA